MQKWSRWRQELASRRATGSKDCVLGTAIVLLFATLKASLMANAEAYDVVAFVFENVKHLSISISVNLSNNM